MPPMDGTSADAAVGQQARAVATVRNIQALKSTSSITHISEVLPTTRG
jgi:hypothetical protein